MAKKISGLSIRLQDGQRILSMTFEGFEGGTDYASYYVTRQAVEGLKNAFERFDEEVYQFEDAHPHWERELRPRVVQGYIPVRVVETLPQEAETQQVDTQRLLDSTPDSGFHHNGS